MVWYTFCDISSEAVEASKTLETYCCMYIFFSFGPFSSERSIGIVSERKNFQRK